MKPVTLCKGTLYYPNYICQFTFDNSESFKSYCGGVGGSVDGWVVVGGGGYLWGTRLNSQYLSLFGEISRFTVVFIPWYYVFKQASNKFPY